MAQQWGAGQPSFQYPMQTGYPANAGQFQQGFGAGLAPQSTGFPGQRPAFQQPQQTGYPGSGPFQPQQTGFQTGLGGFNQQNVPPVPPLPVNLNTSGFRPTPQSSGFLGGQPPQQLAPPPPPARPSFLTSSPGLGGSGLVPQVTGYPGAGLGGAPAPLVPQITGFVDPRLQMMSSSFMPANPSMPFAPGGTPQFAGTLSGSNLQANIQQYNQESRGTAAPKMPWALSRAEKKQYDQIFRSWDSQNTGFISGQTALEVFGQSGLEKNDLAKIWALADADNRGKLNLAEFHVAMGLIYRRLNGQDIPDQLPQELVPPSSRDLDTSVNFLKDILRNEPSRSSSASSDQVSRSKLRSFNDSSPVGTGGRKDATVYKYDADNDSGSYYQSRSRHIDRRNVRVGNESPAEDLTSIKRQLENTAKMLDKVSEDNASRDAEDDALDRELEDLRYRIKRIQDDIDYVSRGPRSTAKDEERRKLERDLLHIMHERIPEVEKKIEERSRRKDREKRDWARDRDRRNERFGRYDDRERSYEYDNRDRDEVGYNRGTFDRERDYDRDYNRDRDRERPYSRNRSRNDYERDGDRDRDRYNSRTPPAAARSPPPAPPASAPPAPKPAEPKPVTSPTPNLKSMTREERDAFIREQAQRRLQERMRALGVVTPSSPTSTVDTSVEDRLVREKKEAEEKARQAEKEAEERERARKERLEGEKAIKEGRAVTPAPPTPAVVATPAPPPPAPIVSAPHPPKRAPAPPPPRKGPAIQRGISSVPVPAAIRQTPAPAPASVARATPTAPPAPPASRAQEEDPEEREIREREERLRKQKEARAERLRQLEKEEEDERRAEEEQQRRATEDARQNRLREEREERLRKLAQAEEEERRAEQEFEKRRQAGRKTPVPPAAPPAPPAPPIPTLTTHSETLPTPVSASSTGDKSSTNPFSKLMNQGSTTGTPSAGLANGGTNPFFRPQTSTTPVAPPAPPAVAANRVSPPVSRSPAPVSKSPAPPAVKTSYNTVPSQSEDEWDDINEKEDDDSSDDELVSSRDTRNKLAQQLFGNIIPPRPISAAGSGPSQPSTPAPLSAPPAPQAPQAPVAPPAPPAPVAPFAPPPPAPAIAAPIPAAASGDRSALFSSIVSGARLRKTVTNDRSAAAVTGQVIGDTAPPSHISEMPRPISPVKSEPELEPIALEREADQSIRSIYRQSVDWYAGLAAEQTPISPLPTTIEEKEEDPPQTLPEIQVNDPVSTEAADPLSDIDMSKEIKVRSLYEYQGGGDDYLSFPANVAINAHPSKSGDAWWYGTVIKGNKSGLFPSTYVQELEQVRATAIYPYSAANPDELSFEEGEDVLIVDRSDADWWKAEREGSIFTVPAAYVEVVEAQPRLINVGVDKNSNTGNEAVTTDRQSLLPSSSDPTPTQIDISNDTSGDDESSDEYHSFDSDSDTDESPQQQTEEERRKEHEARALERQRVLEAAGLIVKKDHRKPPPRPSRKKSVRRRRPPPDTPNRRSAASFPSNKELPATPERVTPVKESLIHIDDAFERYEAYLKSKDYRMSVSSIDSLNVPQSPVTAPALAPSNSKDVESSVRSVFLNLLGRSKTPGSDTERTKLQISGPILLTSGAAETLSRENSPAFGMSWASLVSKDALEQIPPGERKRQEAIFELINTESAYVRDLQLIVEVFYSSMMALLSTKEITVIFANIEDLLLCNTSFLSTLEDRQKECRLYIDNIGDLLAKHMANMEIYANYCVNQGNAIKILQTIREARPDIAAHLQKLREDPTVRNLDLSSYLLAPMQRITRYPLLIKQILTHTESESDRQQILLALKFVESVLNSINESIREQEGRERLRVISKELWIGQGRLDLTAPTRYMGERKLLKEGLLSKYKSGRNLRVFLCNDILVVTDSDAKQLYKMPMQLSEIEVTDVPGARDDLAFQLDMRYQRGGKPLTLKAASARDCDLWMKSIAMAGRRCREAQKRAARRH